MASLGDLTFTCCIHSLEVRIWLTMQAGSYLLIGQNKMGTSIKIRENSFLLESQGKSENFMIFCRGSGKVTEFCLTEVSQDLSLISRHIFIRHDPYTHFSPIFLETRPFLDM